MSQRERDRLGVIARVVKGDLTRHVAAESLRVTERQFYRILRRYLDEGDRGVIHRHRGKPGSNRNYSQGLKAIVSKLFREQYSDYHPTLFSEILSSEHNIDLSRQTLTRWLRSEHLLDQIRKDRPHRRKRERREAIGDLIQFDGSHHDWFEGRGPVCCLLVAIDDASGRVFLRLAESENTHDVLLTLEAYVKRFGIPMQFYTDYGAVYNVPRSKDRKKRHVHDTNHRLTDVGHALKRLGIEHIFARSPQAKGRVERSNRTHQDRLIKALRRENISSITEANVFLERHYIDDHNRRFASEKGLQDVHRSSKDLDYRNIFCYQTSRHVYHDYTIILGGEFFQLERSGDVPLPAPRQEVIVRRWLSDDSIHIFWHDQELSYSRFSQAMKPKVQVVRPHPAQRHPWRRSDIGRSRSRRRKQIREQILLTKKKALSSITSPT